MSRFRDSASTIGCPNVAYLIERVPRNVGSDVVRAKVPDESHDARGITNRDVLRLPEHGVVKDEVLGGADESLIVVEPGDSHQNVTVIARDEGRVDAEVPRYGRLRPASSKGAPRPFELLESEVAEVRLQKLSIKENRTFTERNEPNLRLFPLARASHVPDIVTELHVEVSFEDGGAGLALLTLLRRHRCGILEDVEGRLAKYPGLCVVTWHYPHADAQVTVAAEDIDSAAEPRSLRPGDAAADQQRERPRQEEKPRAWPHF